MDDVAAFVPKGREADFRRRRGLFGWFYAKPTFIKT
jgi:hypothetical protein